MCSACLPQDHDKMDYVITVEESVDYFGFKAVYNVPGILDTMRGIKELPHYCGAISALAPGQFIYCGYSP